MSEDLPEVSVSPTRKVFLSGASIVWVIPLLALVAALFVAWQSFNDRGPLIVIEFQQGAGIKAGETELRYRDVTVGVVEKVGFTAGLEKVTASVRVDKDVAPFIDSSAVFWVVQPEVSAQGITGLSTVLSGVYIEGSWDDEPGPYLARFQGASEPPLIRPGQSGLQIAFRTVANGQLTDNAPILYKGIEVGRVGRASIAPRGNFAIVEALIFEEHRNLINESTRFWDTSGFSVNIGPAGAEIDFSSIATLVGGGITFDTFVSGGGQVQDGTVFEVFPDKESARSSLFNASSVEPLEISVIFDENISGLTVGAPVELSGFKIGEVSALSGVVNIDQFGDSRVRLNANLSIQPARLGLPGDVTADAALSFLQGRVEAGMRARLASASLLTGGLKVELLLVPDAPAAQLVSPDGGLPVMPTTENETSDAAATVEGVFTRINNLPIEELLNSAITFLDSAEALISDEDLRNTPTDVRELLADLQGLVSSDDVRNIPVTLNATLTRVETLVGQLEQERIASKLSAVLDDASTAASAVESSVAGVPALVEQIEAVAAKAESLAIDELVKELTALTASADAVIGTEDAIALPRSLKRALDEVNYTLQELREGGAIVNVNQTLASARNAADSIAVSSKDLPQIVDRLTALFAQAGRTIEGYNKGDELSRSAQAALRDIQKAADALASLARTIERNPNSLLIGR
ncbi:MAG: MCE family protein [Sulfitobacter sp.]|nr:MCE family protein [Sulfitobacter sp.]